MKKSVVFALVALALLCGLGGYGLQRMRSAQASQKAPPTATVAKGDVEVRVVESGTVDAVKVVEVKSRVGGRVASLLVEEGDTVEKGQLIARIDPQETELRVQQDTAQLSGARSAADRVAIEIEQRRVTARADLEQALSRIAQLESEVKVQPTLSSSAVAASEAAVRVARQTREQLVSTTHPLEQTQSSTELTEAEAGVKTAQSEMRRRESLLAKGYEAERSVEQARLQLQSAEARLARARDAQARLASKHKIEILQADERVRQAEAELRRSVANRSQDGIKFEELKSARAAAAKARAALKDVEALGKVRDQNLSTVAQISSVLGESRRQLRETEIRAPISGVVTKKLIQEGELVSSLSSFSSGTPIVRLEDRRTMMIKLDINEIDVARIALGMPAKVEIDALPNEVLTGSVRKIAPASKTAPGGIAGTEVVVRYEVEIWLDRVSPRLRTGMSGRCTLIAARRENVLTLPAEFIGGTGSARYVEVLEGAGKQRRQDVKIGLESGSKVEILEGVAEGVKVGKPKYGGPERKGFMQTGPGD